MSVDAKEVKEPGTGSGWAHGEDSDSEVEAEQEEVEQEDEEEESGSEDEDDDDEESIGDVDLVASVSESKPAVSKAKTPAIVVPLTKKERKEQQKKEIDELDSILSELGAIATPTVSMEASAPPVTEEQVPKGDDKRRRKKKAKAPQTETQTQAEPADEVEAQPVAVDVAAVLRSKLKKPKKVPKNTSTAVQEALRSLEASDSKLKKKEAQKAKKQTYNEFSI
jgi:hypothetical protein